MDYRAQIEVAVRDAVRNVFNSLIGEESSINNEPLPTFQLSQRFLNRVAAHKRKFRDFNSAGFLGWFNSRSDEWKHANCDRPIVELNRLRRKYYRQGAI